MGAFDWFWKAMGSQSERNDKKSKAIVGSADEAARALGQQDDAAVAQAARDAVGCADSFVRERPWCSVGTAAAVGIFIGALLSMRKS